MPVCTAQIARPHAAISPQAAFSTATTHPGKPVFERLHLRQGNGLYYAEKPLGVGAVEVLLAAGGLDGKGGGNLPPPFGKFGIAAAHILDIALRINQISQDLHDINNSKPTFSIMDNFSYMLPFKNSQFDCIFCTHA